MYTFGFKNISIFGGLQWRPNVHLEDVANAFILCLRSPIDKIVGQKFNVGNNNLNYQIKDLGEIVKNYAPDAKIEVYPEAADQRSYRVCFDKIEDVLGYKTTKTIGDGIVEIKNALEDKAFISDYQDPIYYNVKYILKEGL